VRVPYLYHAFKLLLKQEMQATCNQIHQEVGYTVQARPRITGYARWLYIGSLQEGSNIIDHNNVAGKEEAMTTYMKVRSQLTVSHQEYCLAMNEFMQQRGCHMTKFLKIARAGQTKINAASSGGGHGTQGDDVEVSDAVASSLKWYVVNRCRGRGRGTNKQRRKLSIVCSYLFNREQLKTKYFVKRAMSMTGLTRKYIKAGMKKYTQNKYRARRTSEANEVTKERTDNQGCMRFVFDWFHDECPLVELNKDRPARLKGRKQFKKDGRNLERLTCEHHIMNGNKTEIAQSFLDSECYKER
jgi:hypothetical protein